MRSFSGMRASLMAIALLVSGSAMAADGQIKEINDAAEANLQETREKKVEVEKNLNVAKKSEDQDAIDCVQKALQKVNPLVGVSEEARGKVMDYLAIPDIERAKFELRKMDIAAAKVRQFADEANNCIDGSGPQDGNTKVDMTSQALADGDDTSAQVTDDSIVGNDPPNASGLE
jgi:hypothetical protein